MSIKKITIVGTGVMGHPMAAHLLEAGYDLTVFARHREKIEDLLEKGAHYADTLKDAAKDADAIITMLPTEDIVKENIFCENGLADGAKKGTIFFNSSTVSPEANKYIGEELLKRGMRFGETPVTGSGLQAQAKTLVFLYVGDEEDYQEALPVLRAMGVDAYYASNQYGAGAYAKIASNAMMAINMLSFAEAITMATKAGVNPEMFVKFCHGGGPQSAMADKKISKIINRDFSPTFRTALMYKDAGLASDLSKKLEVPTPMLGVGKELYKMACIKGLADEDNCAVIKCYEEWAGIEIKV
ncbi:MAG: NAD(P)-dependent oxidoreductase [Oscillospiraceae bacterium]|nr:NAD(P)-dependent oxidoreductase [Oscillospiraceae bacterium]